MDKIERIRTLARLGLNTPQYIVISKPDDIWLLKVHDTWSIRTQRRIRTRNTTTNIKEFTTAFYRLLDSLDIQHDSSPGFPHLDLVSQEMAITLSMLLLKAGFKLLACEGIDYKNHEFSGAALVEWEQITLELADGPVMVRKVTVDGEIDRRIYYGNKANKHHNDPRVCEVIAQLLMLQFWRGFKPMIVELSYHKNPIGQQGIKPLFWDFHFDDKYEDVGD